MKKSSLITCIRVDYVTPADYPRPFPLRIQSPIIEESLQKHSLSLVCLFYLFYFLFLYKVCRFFLTKNISSESNPQRSVLTMTSHPDENRDAWETGHVQLSYLFLLCEWSHHPAQAMMYLFIFFHMCGEKH